MLGELKERGFVITDEIEGADIAIINTCSFIKEAKEEAIDVILKCAQLKEEGKLKRLIVTGCLPQRYKKELPKELKEVDAFWGVPSALYNHKSPRLALTPSHYSYIKIAEGCANRCTYCAVPIIRGPYRSRDTSSVIKEAESLFAAGARELNLIAQDTTSYGTDLHSAPRLAGLLCKLNKIKGKFWIRLLYTHPAHLSEEIIAAIKDSSKICRYIDLPLQHINDDILKRMGRKTTKAQIIRLIERLRSEIPRLAIRTSLIVGFPGETQAQFEELLDFMREYKFERLGAFAYSKEEGTKAEKLSGHLTEETKQRRLDALMALQEDISREVNGRLMGETLEVLIDEARDGGNYVGRSQADAPEVDGCVYVNSTRALSPGDFVNVRIIDTLEYDLVGTDESSK